MNAPAYSLAVLLASGEPERLYTGLSLLVSTAVDSGPVAGLASFSGLELLCDPALRQRAMTPEHAPAVAQGGRETFARSLEELRSTAAELDTVELYACSASVEAMVVDTDGLDGVLSTPRFLQLTSGARLVAL